MWSSAPLSCLKQLPIDVNYCSTNKLLETNIVNCYVMLHSMARILDTNRFIPLFGH